MDHMDKIKRDIMMTALHLVWSEEVNGGRETISQSFSHDMAQDSFDDALDVYYRVRKEQEK